MSVEERRERQGEKRRKKKRRTRESERTEGVRESSEGMRSPRGVAEDHTESWAQLVARGGPLLAELSAESPFAPILFLSLSLSSLSRSALLPFLLHSCEIAAMSIPEEKRVERVAIYASGVSR